jgi:arginine decarboxylase
LKVRVTAGTGEGPTSLAAFDDALLNAGVANYNLIHLSSVIPPGTSVERTGFRTPPEEYGHRLYVVMARREEHETGSEAWAGLGWTQERDSGLGLFVEAHGPTRAAVSCTIETTLSSMKERRPYAYGPTQSEIVGIDCRGRPVCALVMAVFRSEGWE